MVIDCTLSNLKVPGFPELEPEFGTKKPDMQHITARENNINAMLPFKRQRPFPVTENSTTSVIEAHTPFVIQAAGITLTLGAGAFTGCAVKVFNASGGEVAVVWGENEGESTEIEPEAGISLEWMGAAWKIAEIGTGMASLTDVPEGWGAYVDGCGSNLFDVFGITEGTTLEKIAACFAEIRRRCNNNGEINGSGVPDFTGIQIGDYIDGIDLSAILAAQNDVANTAGQAWNDTYNNNRIVVSGFNTYKGAGDTENAKNHILFTFRNCPVNAKMNASNDNAGGFASSMMKTFLDSTFAPALRAQLNGGGSEDYLYTIRAAHSTKSSVGWASLTLWLPSELEVFGYATYGDEQTNGWNTNVQFPIYQKSYEYRIKRKNGSRQWWFLSTPYSGSAASFCAMNTNGNSDNNSASSVGGCAPAFCVA